MTGPLPREEFSPRPRDAGRRLCAETLLALFSFSERPEIGDRIADPIQGHWRRVCR